jgi:plastocyanin
MRFSKLYGILVLSLVIFILLLSSCVSNSTPVKTSPPTNLASPPAASGAPVTINLTAQNMAFDKSTITVSAGAQVTIIFDNKDSVPHNFVLYTDTSAATVIFKGELVSSKTITYNFTAPSKPGNYFFRCDVHPQIMTGTFIVQ